MAPVRSRSFLKLLLVTVTGGLGWLVMAPFAALFHRRVRMATIPLIGIAIGVALFVNLRPLPPSPPDSLTPGDLRAIALAVEARLKIGGPNFQHTARIHRYVQPLAAAIGANVSAVRAAALLHDVTKENTGDSKTVFCQHGADGAQVASSVLNPLGKSPAFVERVADSIREHMGPTGFNWRQLRSRFMSRYCDGVKFPAPASREAQVLFDADMLDLMTVNGVAKVVRLRQSDKKAFGEETIRQAALDGKDSAYNSVLEARQTLITRPARACGADLTAHVRAFLDGIDWSTVTDVDGFDRAVAAYLARAALPSCLPQPPPS